MSENNNDNKRKLYDALSKDYDMGSYEQFVKDIQDESKRRKLYDATSKEYDFGDYDSFSKQLGMEETKSGSVSEPSSATVPPAEDDGQQPWKPTAQQKAAMTANLENISRSAQQTVDDFNERMDNMQEYGKRFGGGQTVSGGLRFNPGTKKMERTYLTPTGDRTFNKTAADAVSREYREAVDTTVGGQIRRAQRRLEDLQEKARQRQQEIHDKWEQDYKNNKAPLAAVLAADTYVPSFDSDQTYRALQVAIRQTQEQLKTLQEQQDRDNGVDVGFWRGFGRAAGDIRSWDFGIGDMKDALTMLRASDDKHGLPPTDKEREANQEMLKAIHENQQTEAMYGGNASFWNRAGMMTGYMPSFMVDFALTGGGFEGINLATRAAGKAATKMLGKEAVKEMAEQGFKTYVKRNGLKGLGQEAANWTVKALGTTADELLIRAPLMTNTVQLGDTTADIIERRLGDVEVDENGNYDFTNDKTWGSAVWQGEANSVIENYSEMFGAHLPEVASLKSLGKLANVIGAKRLSGMLAKANAGALGGITDTTRRIFGQMGVNDYLGEVSEEYYGQLWRTMLNLDDAYQQNADGTRTNLFATGQFHGDIWGGMALSMGLMGAGKATMSAANYLSMKHDVNKADARASELLTPDIWEPLRSTIDMATNDNVGDVAETIMNGKELTNDEKAAVLNYMERSLYLRGANLAELVNSRGEVQDDRKQQANDSYIDGYNAQSDEEMQDARNMYELQRQKAEQALSPEVLAEIDADPIGALQDLVDDSEAGKTAIDYINAKQVYDGMIQRVRDDIDSRIDQSNAMIDSRVNRVSGMIQGATMKVQNDESKDRRVYVLDGNLAALPDGTGIDHENSDASIIIRDADTGAIEMVSPDAIFSVEQPIDPETEKLAAAEAIRQQLAAEAAGRIDGIVAFNPGDTYTLTDENGQASQIQIMANQDGLVDNGDGTVNVSSDGGQTVVPMSKEDIQVMVDATNRARVAQLEQQRNADIPQPRQEYNLNDEVTLRNDDGSLMHGVVIDNNYDDGTILLQVETPQGERVIPYTREDLDRLRVVPAENIQQNGSSALSTVNQEAVNNATVDDLMNISSSYNYDFYREHPERVIEIISNLAKATSDYINGNLSDRDYLVALGYSTGPNSWLNTATDEEVASTVAENKDKYLPYVTMPQVQEAGTSSTNEGNNGDENFQQNGNIEPQNIPTTAETLQEDSGETLQVSSALERIPKDEQGQPIYEQADPETAWDALLEQTGGNEAIAQEVANDMVADKEAAVKKLEKQKPKSGTTPAEKIAARLEQNRIVEQAKAELTQWQKIAQTSLRRKQAALAEQSRAAEEAARLRREQEEKERAEREEAERIRREALNGVPDFVEDTPQDARARGYRRVNGNKVDRQQAIPTRQGNEVQVKFDDNNIPTGHVALIDASQLQPSHINGKRNPLHFIDEAQPKERNDDASVMSARKIAANIRPEEITSSVTAYTGAPTVNSRGEVIQGNNRSAALREMWAEHPEQATKYKQYLTEHAADFGLAPEDVETMQQPVLVNMLDVTDDDAIALGQFVAQDTESGGTERIKPKNIMQKMGDDMRSFSGQLLASPDEEMSFAELVDRNGLGVLKWMQQKGYITPTQYKSAFDSKGGLTAEAKNDLKGVMYQSIFQKGNTHLEEMFNALPSKAQKAILATAYRDYDSPNAERMNAEIQNSISAYYALSQDPAFANAKNYKEARIAVESWKRQLAFDDVTGESYLPAEKYSNFALLLATMYKGQTQTFIQNTFKNIFDLVQGTQETTLFDEPDNTPRTLVDAINETINNVRTELLINNQFNYNGQQRSNVLAGGSAASQQGRQRSDGSAPAGGRDENSAGALNNNGRTGISDNERGGQGDIEDIAGRQHDDLGASEIRLSDEIDENGRQFVLTSNGQLSFGEITEESGLTPAPILLSEGIITNPTTNDGYGFVHIEARHGDQIRKAGYKSVIKFIEDVAQNYERVKEGNIRNGNPTYLIQLKDKHNNTLIVELSSDGNYWNINTAGIFKESYGKNRKEIYNRHTTVKQSAETVGASQEVEQSGTTTSSSMNAPTSSIVPETSEPTNSRTDVDSNLSGKSDGTATRQSSDVSVHKNTDKSSVTQTIGEKVAKAEEETDTNPTEAQKEAGNYKKGHVRIGQFDITVENPKGSVRRGVDASGKAWEQTMQNTYGYIRGTEGVDGDHIDVFLTNDIDGWNGRRVYIVDQYNEDGTFDEHKMMLGFNNEAEAQDAYLSNYEKGWEYKHKLVMSSVNLPDFEKWINSSHRKTKPFAEYKSVNKANVANEPNAPEAGFEIAPAQYTTKRGKVLNMFLVTFAEPLSKEQQRAARELAKAEKGWYDRDKGGFMMRSEESARKLADTITGNEEALSDAQPLSLADTRKLEEPVMRQVDVEGLMQAIRENGEAKLSDHLVPQSEQKEETSVQETESSEQNEENAYGANNKLVSRDRYEELKARMRRKLGGQLDMGIDPEILAIGTEMAAYHIEAGARKFADYATHMIADLGDAIRPYLKSFYNGARDLPEVQEADLANEMTPYDEVRTFDVANFDKGHSDALATAEMVVQEQEAAKQAEEAKEKLTERRNSQRKEKESRKKSISSQTQVADLFGGLFEENASTEAAASQDNELNRKFAMTVKDDMLAALDNGTKPYRSILDLRKRASGLGMEVDNDGRTDILLQELVEDGLVRAAREVAERHGSDSKETYDLICKLYEMQPTIAARSSNRIKMQQYSTPLPMAWNAARFVMTGKKGGKVLEPTAGNGMLVFAIPAVQVHANELDGTRLSNLREQGFAKVTQQDATEPFEGGKQYDVVIANPPFGKREAVDYDGKLISGLDPQITLNALACMKDDGHAAIIIGGNMEYAKNGAINNMKPFFTYLYDHYNVKGVVDMDGSLFTKQGTTYPTRMILIDGRRSEEDRAQSAVYPPVQSKAIRKADSFEALYDIIDEVINSKDKTNGTEILRSQQGQLVPVTDQPSRNTDGKRHTEQPRKDDTGRSGGRTSVEGTQEPGEVVLRGEHRTDTGSGEARRGVSGNTGGESRGVSESDVQRVGTVGVSTERVGLEPPRTEQPKKRTLTEEKSAYRPHNSAFSLQSVAPAAMVEAMDRTLSQIEKKHGNIDEFVRKELGYDTTDELHQALAAEQVDSVAMAIYQMKQGQALIIGDQTGVGKGRQMAALIRWAVRQGEKPIFITQKADLFSDIYRDLVDVGSGDLVPFIFNSPSAKENKGEMVDANGKVVYKGLSDAKMKKVLATGKLPDEYDYAVLTYSQVNTGDEVSQKEMEEAAKKNGARSKKSKNVKSGKATPKATFLRAIAEDNYLFLDESHTAAGSSNTGAYLQSILRSAKAATFASATFAKRPDTMPLYAIRTAMSQAKVEPDKLISIIEKGGVTLQEIMSRELTNAGQMVRRERDMSDVVTDWKTINDPETVRRARENYDRTIAAFNAIIKFQEDYVKPMVDAMDKELAVMAESAGIKRGTDKINGRRERSVCQQDLQLHQATHACP